MINFQMLKSPVRWIIFLLIVGMIITIILAMDLALSHLNIQVSRLQISIIAGVISGVILIFFDIIVFQGLEYEEGQKEQRMMLRMTEVMCSEPVRHVIREEVKKILDEEKT